MSPGARSYEVYEPMTLLIGGDRAIDGQKRVFAANPRAEACFGGAPCFGLILLTIEHINCGYWKLHGRDQHAILILDRFCS